uniref:Uncharacterized protein n=1 Tax=Strigamia maritima TaxID=126957 RepID=T1IZG8_STRMM
MVCYMCLFVILLCVQVGESQYFKLYRDGTYDFNYHTSGGQHRSEVRYADGTILGKYAYITPVGQKIDVEYSAGKHGYKEKRKISKVGIKKTGLKLKIQTQPTFGYGHAPFLPSSAQSQILESVKQFPVFRPHIGNNELNSHSKKELKYQNLNLSPVYIHPSTQKPPINRNYPSEDENEHFDFDPTTKSTSVHFNPTTHKPDELLWIPSAIIKKPRMPPVPIWMKPTTEDFRKMFTTTEKPLSVVLPPPSFIFRQPLRRPVPMALSHKPSATTEKPTGPTQAMNDTDDDAPCFKIPVPLKNNSRVSVNLLGSSGIVNLKPFELLTHRLQREDVSKSPSIRLRAVMTPPKPKVQQFLPSNGFSVFPGLLESQKRLNTNVNLDQNQENNPSQHISSSIITIHDRPRSQQSQPHSADSEIVPFSATNNRLFNANPYNSKFQVPIFYNFQEKMPLQPFDFINSAGNIQPRKD